MATNRSITFNEPAAPWHEPVNGADLLNQLYWLIHRYVILSHEAKIAISLWIIHTYAHDYARISPSLAIISPERECGKTTLLSLLAKLVRRALSSSSITPAAIYRVIEKCRPTLLIDEGDTFLKENDPLKGILNSGHTRDTANTIRCEGKNYDPQTFSTWAPKVYASIREPWPTLMDRSIRIEMRRNLPNEEFQRLRDIPEAMALKQMMMRWVNDNAQLLYDADPLMPDGISGRSADNWEPLFAIADAAGGEWPNFARSAAQALKDNEPHEEDIGIQLLTDLQDIFIARRIDRLSTNDILGCLIAIDGSQWMESNNGRPINSRQLANLLKPYRIRPTTIRFGTDGAKGYYYEHCKDAFTRYLKK